MVILTESNPDVSRRGNCFRRENLCRTGSRFSYRDPQRTGPRGDGRSRAGGRQSFPSENLCSWDVFLTAADPPTIPG
jgi:hypothetical protein